MLPIVEFLPGIAKYLAVGGNLVLQAEPGAGKSTALPMSLIGAEWLQGKKILMLEPRRVAAKSIAHYLARQLNEKVGQRVGYQIKNDRKTSKETALEIVTEGILTRRLQNEPEISDIGLIIFDEFHERSLHADLSLLLALEIQQTIREDLRLLVMSATIDTGLLASYMGGANVIECPGRVFPVTLQYQRTGNDKGHTGFGVNSRTRSELLVRQVSNTLSWVLRPETRENTKSAFVGDADVEVSKGDVLVFLPGQADIRRSLSAAHEIMDSDNSVLLLPLYGGLSLAEQERALTPDPDGKRRVVFTTNIAETSLTIEGVTCVIDSGLEKVLVYDPASGMTRLQTVAISKASAEQRKGRAGRLQAGHCIRLWDEQKHHTLRDFQAEEILSADLSGLVLELSIWGAGGYEDIHWLTPPPRPHFESAQTTLHSLGLIDAEQRVTELGGKVAGIGLSPRLAAMILKAERLLEKSIACELAVLLSDRDIFHQKTGTDIVDRLLAVQDYKANASAAVKQLPIKRAAMQQLLLSAALLRRAVKVPATTSKESYSLSQLQSATGPLLLFAYPDRLAKRRSVNGGRYQLANGKGVFLFEDDPLFGSEWLVVADCDAQKQEGRIFSAAAIAFDSVLTSLELQFKETEHYQYDPRSQKITGRRVTEYGAITIRSKVISDILPEKFQQCLLPVLQERGFDVLNWTRSCEEWLLRAQWLGEQLDDFPELSKARLLDSLDSWLLPYIVGVNSIAALKRVNVMELLVGILSWQEQQVLAQQAPTDYQTPSNKKVPVVYDPQQGPTVSVALQEMFGEIDSPKIAGGRVALRFELLSPARRPIQTTSDLANFWKTSYFEVAKEMRGRYPKHRWPEQPLLEKPGRSIKRR